MVSKEAKTMIEDYLKKVDKSMTEISKARKQEILKTLRSHIMDAIEDQKGKMPETKIVRNAIKDLGEPKTESFAKKLIPWIVITIVGLSIFVLENIAGRGHTFSLPYFVCVFSALGIAELWPHTIGRRFEDRRIDIIGLWLVYLVVVVELFLLEYYITLSTVGPTTITNIIGFFVVRDILLGIVNPPIVVDLLLLDTLESFLLETLTGLPALGGLSLTSIVAVNGGILGILMSVFMILRPGEFQSKRCLNCGKEVDGNAKFCWNCGEEIM
ncbi:MAG: hypothetical protein ACETWM_09305 [Candidatus Lokiarchaeia archaeon]